MSKKDKYIKNVVLGGQNLVLATDISEKHLDNVYEYVNEKLINIMLNKKLSTNLLIGILLGVEIADEYFIEKSSLLDEINYLKEQLIKNSAVNSESVITEIKKVKEQGLIKIKELEVENQNLKNKNKAEIDSLTKLHNEDLKDFKIVYEEEIHEIQQLLNTIKVEKDNEIATLKQVNAKKEKDIVKVIDENTKLNEENEILRNRLALFLENNASKDNIVERSLNEDTDDDIYIELNQLDLEEAIGEVETVVEKPVDINKTLNHKRKRRKGKK